MLKTFQMKFHTLQNLEEFKKKKMFIHMNFSTVHKCVQSFVCLYWFFLIMTNVLILTKLALLEE